MEFSLEKTDESTLPPIINALEVYMIKGLSQSTTDPDDGIFFCLIHACHDHN